MPVSLGCCPVKTLAREGLQSGTWVIARSKVVPISASRSRFGVFTSEREVPPVVERAQVVDREHQEVSS